MKKNISFIIIIFILLIVEMYFHQYCYGDLRWRNSCRVLSWILMGIWYYEKQKENFTHIQKVFLISILLPIIIAIAAYFIPERELININIYVNMGILMLLIYVFKHLGASVSLTKSNKTLQKLAPVFFILPLLYYYFSLYPSLSGIYVVFVLIYVLIFSCTGLLAALLPINDGKRFWITSAIILLVVVNIINAYNIFLQKLQWAYPVVRTLTVVLKCMMIYGMIRYVEKKHLKTIEGD